MKPLTTRRDDALLTCKVLLVEAHCGNLYTVEARDDMERQKAEIMRTCEQCGDNDYVIGDAATWGQLCDLLIGQAKDGVEADYLMEVARQEGEWYCPRITSDMFDRLEPRLQAANRAYWADDEQEETP